MNLSKLVTEFTLRPFPLWNNEVVNHLVADKMENLSLPYSLTNCILKESVESEITRLLPTDQLTIVLPSIDLQYFYQDHGLNPLSADDSFDDAIKQVQRALDIFKQIPAVHTFVISIVKSIQLLKTDDPETDMSYSHPDIPFSIFVSVCENNSSICNLRVAESILHEAMHLELTLMEDVLEMVNPKSKDVYYSPWRGEERPLRGVLHGLYVFTAILDFYAALIKITSDESLTAYLRKRIEIIKEEFTMLHEFPKSPGLTPSGRNLATNILHGR